MNDTQRDQTLVDSTLTLLEQRLQHFGNRVNAEHSHALKCIVTRMMLLATRKLDGRWIYDLDCGMGKSLATSCFIATAHRHGRSLSVAVAAAQIEGLCKTKRDLIELGVPAELIGLRHSYEWSEEKVASAMLGLEDDYASEPTCTDAELASRPYALVSHQRLRNPAKADTYNTFKGRDRDLVVWDEALLTAHAQFVEWDEVAAMCAWLKYKLRPTHQRAAQAVKWLGEALRFTTAALGTGTADSANTIDLPELIDGLDDSGGVRILEEAAKTWRDLPKEGIENGKALFDMAERGEPVRVSRFATDSRWSSKVVISYRVTVPDSLERMVVLDASYAVNALEQIESLEKDPSFSGRVKRYDRTTLHVREQASGKGQIAANFPPGKKSTPALRLVLDTIAKHKGPMLFFAHKPFKEGRRTIDALASLQRAMRAAGINPDATMKVHGKVRPRWPMLTWGAAETASNEFAHCTAVVFLSTFYRSHEDLYSQAVGLQRDLEAEAPNVAEIQQDLAVHHLYQGANRACSRLAIDAEAPRCDFYLFNQTLRIREQLQALMPGLRVTGWGKRKLEALAPDATLTAQLAVACRRAIDRYEMDGWTEAFSVKGMWKDLKLQPVANSTKQLALKAALETRPLWRNERGWLRRAPRNLTKAEKAAS